MIMVNGETIYRELVLVFKGALKKIEERNFGKNKEKQVLGEKIARETRGVI